MERWRGILAFCRSHLPCVTPYRRVPQLGMSAEVRQLGLRSALAEAEAEAEDFLFSAELGFGFGFGHGYDLP